MFNRMLSNKNAYSLQLIRMFSSKIRLVQSRDSASSSATENSDSIKTTTELKEKCYDERNKHLNRPLSPHLSIYKLQNNMILSISHRASGAALSGLISGMAFVVSFSSVPFSELIQRLEEVNLSPILLMGCKFCIALTFSFHMLNGIRHMIWDSGHGLRSKTVDFTGYFVLIFSLMLAIHLTMLSG